jgi:hypothetical protein
MDPVKELAVCQRELQRLTAENAALRYSSETFGDLAERLNVALKIERRSTGETREMPPGSAPPGMAPQNSF